jgi:Glycosyl transferase family 11
MKKAKIIVRISGGLGNQLFTYAAARRLSLVNNAELVIDDETGFLRDIHQRSYGLDVFSISARKATDREKLKPFGRIRRRILRTQAKRIPFIQRAYIYQEELDFDSRLLQLQPQGTVYMEGYWQSENYFVDVANTIRSDLRLSSALNAPNLDTEAAIRNCCAIALHVRWFNPPGTTGQNAPSDYYRRAVAFFESRIRQPHYFVFSDNAEATRKHLPLPVRNATYVNHNDPDSSPYADLWLMSQCDHFIIANSTFSWWGAWLAANPHKIIVAPSVATVSAPAWTFRGLIPEAWHRI